VRSRTPYRVVVGAVASDAEARDDVVGALACPGARGDGIARRRRASRVAPGARVGLAVVVGVGVARAHGVGVGVIVRVAQCRHDTSEWRAPPHRNRAPPRAPHRAPPRVGSQGAFASRRLARASTIVRERECASMTMSMVDDVVHEDVLLCSLY
jgi:hypothetical protein